MIHYAFCTLATLLPINLPVFTPSCITNYQAHPPSLPDCLTDCAASSVAVQSAAAIDRTHQCFCGDCIGYDSAAATFGTCSNPIGIVPNGYEGAVGYCKGGPAWPNGDVHDCSAGSVTSVQCAAACDANSECFGYDVTQAAAVDNTATSECCIYQSGSSGDSISGHVCYTKKVFSKLGYHTHGSTRCSWGESGTVARFQGTGIPNTGVYNSMTFGSHEGDATVEAVVNFNGLTAGITLMASDRGFYTCQLDSRSDKGISLFKFTKGRKYTGKHCAQASGTNYGTEDLTTSGTSTFAEFGTRNLQECESHCRETATCSYYTYAASNNGHCLLYSACAGEKVYDTAYADALTYALEGEKTEEVAKTNSPDANGQDIKLKLELIGNALTCFKNDVMELTVTTTGFDTGASRLLLIVRLVIKPLVSTQPSHSLCHWLRLHCDRVQWNARREI